MDWTFNTKEIAETFDSHVREQLPWYDLASETVAMILRNYVREEGVVYDIGTSTGNIPQRIEKLAEERRLEIYGIDCSGHMAEKFKAQYGEVICADARDYDYYPFAAAVCFLTISFFPVDDRKEFLAHLLASCERGGVIVIVDKFGATGGYAGTVLRRITTWWKLKTGATSSDILAKDLSLSGVQRPLSREDLPEHAVQFFQLGEFQGWIIEN